LSSRLRVRSPQPSTAATFHPRRFTRPRRLNPLRPLPKSPSNTTRGVSPFKALPTRWGPRRLRHCLPSWPSSRLLPPSRGRVASPCCRAGPSGSYSCDSTVSADFWLPIRRGPFALLGSYFVGPRFLKRDQAET